VIIDNVPFMKPCARPPKAHENWGNWVSCFQEKLIPCTNNHVKCKGFDTPYGKG